MDKYEAQLELIEALDSRIFWLTQTARWWNRPAWRRIQNERYESLMTVERLKAIIANFDELERAEEARAMIASSHGPSSAA